MSGIFHLSYVQDSAIGLTCDDQIAIGDVTLEFLKDNIGDNDIYTPLCVFYSESASDRTEIENGSDDVINTNMFWNRLLFMLCEWCH